MDCKISQFQYHNFFQSPLLLDIAQKIITPVFLSFLIFYDAQVFDLSAVLVLLNCLCVNFCGEYLHQQFLMVKFV